MLVYLDESGDTGWKFLKPYRHGGSSRYLCLAFLFLPKRHWKLPRKIIADLYHKYRWVHEMKACKATDSQKIEFCKATQQMLLDNQDIKIACIVVKKQNVQQHIQTDPNKLYNYMCKLVVVDHVARESEIEFIPDKRSIKVESGNSLSDYLQTSLWFDHNAKTKVVNNPQESDKNYNLQFVDWIANCVWSHFEDAETTVYPQIGPHIKVRHLFF